jgi:hypothetical protein
LLDASVKPEHIGCAHLKAIFSSPDAYGIRKELAEFALKVYLNVYFDAWNPLRKRMLYVTLKGAHKKTAGVEVFTPNVCVYDAPLIVPNPTEREWDGTGRPLSGDAGAQPLHSPCTQRLHTSL